MYIARGNRTRDNSDDSERIEFMVRYEVAIFYSLHYIFSTRYTSQTQTVCFVLRVVSGVQHFKSKPLWFHVCAVSLQFRVHHVQAQQNRMHSVMVIYLQRWIMYFEPGAHQPRPSIFWMNSKNDAIVRIFFVFPSIWFDFVMSTICSCGRWIWDDYVVISIGYSHSCGVYA